MISISISTIMIINQVRNGPQLDVLNIMGMGKQRMARSLTL